MAPKKNQNPIDFIIKDRYRGYPNFFKEYDTFKELMDFQQNKTKSLSNSKQLLDKKTKTAINDEWADNLLILQEFMGSSFVWETCVPGVVVSGITGKAGHRKTTLEIKPYNRAFYSGSHWTSQLKNTTDVFDPYEEYQIRGTNQFCQTFAMMYLKKALPNVVPKNTKAPLKKYYTYTKEALKFIKKQVKIVFDKLQQNNREANRNHFYITYTTNENVKVRIYEIDLSKALEHCTRHPAACVNYDPIVPQLHM